MKMNIIKDFDVMTASWKYSFKVLSFYKYEF